MDQVQLAQRAPQREARLHEDFDFSSARSSNLLVVVEEELKEVTEVHPLTRRRGAFRPKSRHHEEKLYMVLLEAPVEQAAAAELADHPG